MEQWNSRSWGIFGSSLDACLLHLSVEFRYSGAGKRVVFLSNKWGCWQSTLAPYNYSINRRCFLGLGMFGRFFRVRTGRRWATSWWPSLRATAVDRRSTTPTLLDRKLVSMAQGKVCTSFRVGTPPKMFSRWGPFGDCTIYSEATYTSKYINTAGTVRLCPRWILWDRGPPSIEPLKKGFLPASAFHRSRPDCPT